ncbi:bifunctional cobalt-precorrin-7 (C(5))-methyltransferase/cobalt-precorrin-6B (C(15))-methyltransferase [Paenibacillus sp. FSL H7-0331]|uniref:bifunctional cobalt-precorrin-7 (C(5))-methyltransferase/cobalt-precorrin-6B (C(15))-methyltransferase n=1 Tax=Paenibacillus sp. FSL H7-0331 TaxID=1920421 RepID=UPI00096BFE40|nr:bifunctional cobalt-precorrin-7 (C(5))-methyltransferase/cobalt-precorrin-6B (C(15))-methyltransferase [Paenibacillus sp. FSL H7-0331]OMF13582.1 cobalamin biosynthesis protein CbiE [Paenibacillus sp. FSL H7-0331]
MSGQQPHVQITKPKVIGIGDNGRDSLLPLYADWIDSSELLVGGERQLQFFPDHQGEQLIIKGGLSELAARLKTESEQGRSVVVLASGDPFFYGIGGYLSSKLAVEVYPNLSSIQLAFARMGESWQDAEVVSVHGRSIKGLAQRIDGKKKVALLTDETNSPQEIARYLLAFGMTEYRVFVAENLDGPSERTDWYELQELAEQATEAFSPLNVVILRQRPGVSSADLPQWPFGIDDELFAQRKPDKGLITKKEIRVLSLAQMGLRSDSIVWDIGTCTGSVAIEAARIARQGAVYAIEKNEADLANCLENMTRFRADITVIQGRAPQGLETFADPDAVFIGGSGGEMKELLHVCCTRLRPGGRIVLNAVTIENLYEANRTFAEEGFATNITLAQISRSKPILDMTRFEGLNPVYIITARHQEPESAAVKETKAVE